MHPKYLLLIIIISTAAAGCASTPISTDMAAVMADPARFRNELIEITAPVLENSPPQGDDYRTWSFTIGTSAGYRIMASEEGFNPSTIEKAYLLVEDARRAGEPVTVTGRLRVGPYRELESGMEVELVSVRYGAIGIRTDKGPFVRRYSYYPYYSPFYLHFGYYHHYGHHHH